MTYVRRLPRGGRRDVEAATASRHNVLLPTGQQHVASVPMRQMLLLRVSVTKATGSSPDAYANGTALGVVSVVVRCRISQQEHRQNHRNASHAHTPFVYIGIMSRW